MSIQSLKKEFNNMKKDVPGLDNDDLAFYRLDKQWKYDYTYSHPSYDPKYPANDKAREHELYRVEQEYKIFKDYIPGLEDEYNTIKDELSSMVFPEVLESGVNYLIYEKCPWTGEGIYKDKIVFRPVNAAAREHDREILDQILRKNKNP